VDGSCLLIYIFLN